MSHNHPNHSGRSNAPGVNPTGALIREARQSAGLTQTQAARMIYSTLRTWQDWEGGKRRMHPALWEYWCRLVQESEDGVVR